MSDKSKFPLNDEGGVREATSCLNDIRWISELFDLNPWAEPWREVAMRPDWRRDDESVQHRLGEDDEFRTARRDAAIKRGECGEIAWNNWARSMSDLEQRALAAGLWKGAVNLLGDALPDNCATAVHIALSITDFTNFVFAESCSFDNFVFPGRSDFSNCHFTAPRGSEGINFSHSIFLGSVDFSDAEFKEGEANFYNASFAGGDATFERTLFSGGRAQFLGAEFGAGAHFWHTKFVGGGATFARARFHRGAAFSDAEFSGGEASFSGASFLGAVARFEGARFAKGAEFNAIYDAYIDKERRGDLLTEFYSTANFTGVEFGGATSFTDARFHKEAMFNLAQIKGGFSLANARFVRVPDSIGTTFNEPPRLDNARIVRCAAMTPPNRTLSWFRRHFLLFWAADGDDHARFRKLRTMANQSKDHENELRFNADEIACRRFWVDKPAGRGMARFWFGWLYEKIANCGQSLIRPLLGWSAILLIFAMLYLSSLSGRAASELAMSRPLQAEVVKKWPTHGALQLVAAFEMLGGTIPGTTCHWTYEEARTRVDKEDGKVVREIRFQETTALAEAFVLSFRNALIFDRSDVSRRMYGCLYGIQDKGGQDYPTVPPLVTALSTVQSFLSAVFIFLFGLGLRNMFRIK